MPRDACERAARHQDHAAAGALDGVELHRIGANHVIARCHRVRAQMVGAAARRDERLRHVARFGHRALHEFERDFPRQTHAALRGVHRFGNAEALPDQITPVLDGARPVERGGLIQFAAAMRIGDDVRRRIRDAVERCARRRTADRIACERVGVELAGSGRKNDLHDGGCALRRARRRNMKTRRAFRCRRTSRTPRVALRSSAGRWSRGSRTAAHVRAAGFRRAS